MILDADIKSQLAQYLDLMEDDILIKVSTGSDNASNDMLSLIDELAGMSSKIKVEKTVLERTPSFSVSSLKKNTGVVFAGVPLGHEFTSLVLALLQVSGRAPKVDSETVKQIKNIKGSYNFETYVSLSCHNCPDVVQALNLMSILNPNITHTMIDGAVFKREVESKNILAVPSVYLNGTHFNSGRMTLTDILSKIGSSSNPKKALSHKPYDVLIVGGGPAGASAAIYAARKGIRTGIIAERFGGQVMDTVGIENFIGTKYIEGPELSANLEEHVKEYNVDIINSQRAVSLEKKDLIEILLENGTLLKSKTVILSTGARWRNVGVPGEKELKNNSLSNVTVITNAETREITGTDRVDGINHRPTGKIHHIELQGVFVQIGLIPNTDWLHKAIARNSKGESEVNSKAAVPT